MPNRAYNLRRRGMNVHEIADVTGASAEDVVAALADPSLVLSGGGGGGDVSWQGTYSTGVTYPKGSIVRDGTKTWIVSNGTMPGTVAPGADPNVLTWKGHTINGGLEGDPTVDYFAGVFIISDDSPVDACYPERPESKLLILGVKCVVAGPVKFRLEVSSSEIGFLSGDTELAIYHFDQPDEPIVVLDDDEPGTGVSAGMDPFDFEEGLYVLVGTHKRQDVNINGEYILAWQPPGNQGSTTMQPAYFGPEDMIDATWDLVAE